MVLLPHQTLPNQERQLHLDGLEEGGASGLGDDQVRFGHQCRHILHVAPDLDGGGPVVHPGQPPVQILPASGDDHGLQVPDLGQLPEQIPVDSDGIHGIGQNQEPQIPAPPMVAPPADQKRPPHRHPGDQDPFVGNPLLHQPPAHAVGGHQVEVRVRVDPFPAVHHVGDARDEPHLAVHLLPVVIGEGRAGGEHRQDHPGLQGPHILQKALEGQLHHQAVHRIEGGPGPQIVEQIV